MSRRWGALVAMGVVACSGGTREEPPASEVVDSPMARAMLTRLVAHPRHVELEGAEPGFVLEKGLARFSRRANALVPSFGTELPPHARVHVELPANADAPIVLEDVSTHRSIAFALVSASHAKAEIADGLVLYPAAFGGADVVHRPIPEGTEDFVFFDTAPHDPELRYRVDVSQFAGLRLVGNTVEFVDDRAAPRLRATSPWVYDAKGIRHEGTLSIEGCAYNADPSIAALRKVVAPGASTCDVVLRWESSLAHPIVVDPVWSTAGTMKSKRKQPASTIFGDITGYSLIVAGGHDGTDYLTSVEGCYIDSPPCTFSSWPSMASKRGEFPTLFLASGYELTIFGGRTAAGTASNTAEYYSAGAWKPTTNTMSAARASYKAVALDGDTALITGGSAGGLAPTSSVDVYDMATHSFTAKAALKTARWGHTITALGSPVTSVLVTGGFDGTNVLSSAEIYNVSANTWTLTGTSLSSPRVRHAAALVNDVVLVAGGTTMFSGAPPLATTDLFTISTTKFAAGPSMTVARELLTLTSLGKRALAAGGGSRTTSYSNTAELYDRGTGIGTWVSAGTMAGARGEHAAEAFADALLIGGIDMNTGTTPLATVEEFRLDIAGAACTDARLCGSSFCVDSVCCNASSCTSPAKCNNPLRKGDCTKANGLACSTNSECDSSHCVDGVCCNTACTGTCQACSAALKGTGTDGTCGNVAAGVSSPDCSASPVSACGQDGKCDGAGACRKWVSTTVCAPASCAGTVLSTADLCNGTGTCVDSGTKDCAPFLCTSGACTTTCVNDTQCTAGGYCESGVCKTDLADGGACVRKEQCKSGNCVDGVCCNTACNSLCQACAKAVKEDGSADGICGLAKSNTDPHNECAVDATTTCGRDGFCDGGGKCKLYKPGTGCGSLVCEGSVAKGQLCDGFGVCKSDSAGKDCAPFKCVDGVGCKTTCTIDTDCLDGNFCDATTKSCKPKAANGSTCTAGIACGSGICVIAKGESEGVCCNVACAGQCESCLDASAKGTCIPVNGEPRDGKDACPMGSDACGARSCNGSERNSCAGFAPTTVSCKAASCADGVALLASSCDGKGVCSEQVSVKCEPYVCAGDACGKTCDTDAQCAPKFRCDPTKHDCVPRDTNTCSADGLSVVGADGTISSCSPYVCQAGACKGTCGTSADCAPGNLCDTASAHCQAAPAEEDSGGCGCSTPGGARGGGLFAIALALATLRRRALRRNE